MRIILAVAFAAVSLLRFSSLGFAGEANPTIKDFLATCSTVRHVPRQKDTDTYIDCMNKTVMAAMSPDYCPPPAHTLPDAVLLATVEWLKQHPDTFTMDEIPGLLFALKALYCH